MMAILSLRRLVAAVPVALALTLSASAEKPNILLFLVDDLGWRDISSNKATLGNGSLYHQTPTIDALANTGITFTSAYAIHNCEPTRAALLAGQYSPRTNVITVDGMNQANNPGSTLIIPPPDVDGLDTSVETVAERLQAAGYMTGHVGKFHATNSAAEILSGHGFDVNFGGNTWGSPGNYTAVQNSGDWVFGSNRVGPELDAFADPYTQSYINDFLLPYANGNNPNTLLNDAKSLNDAEADAAIAFIQQSVAAEKPFFLHLGFHLVHTPYQSRSDLRTKYQGITPPNSEHDDPTLAGMVEHVDQIIARILNYLDDNNLRNNTLIVFVSDNGGHVGRTDNAPLRGRKGMQTEGGLRVPLIFNQPGVVPAGTSRELVHVVDLYPTFLEFAQGTLPVGQPIDGESIANIVRGTQKEKTNDAIFFHMPGYLDTRSRPTSIITKDIGNLHYKLWYLYETSTYELYNLNEDIGEADNLLSGTPGAIELAIAAQLSTELRNWLDSVGATYGTWRSSGQPVAPPTPLVGPPTCVGP